MKKIDFDKALPELYHPKSAVTQIDARAGMFLAIDGIGAPGGSHFQQAIGELFAAAYTLKFALKAQGLDYRIPKLEWLWPSDPLKTPRSQWPWRALLRVPDTTTQKDLSDVRERLKERGRFVAGVRLMSWTEGAALQAVHVGPYSTVMRTYAELEARAKQLHATAQGPGHEIYLNDPRRTKPERLKTIVRMPIVPNA